MFHVKRSLGLPVSRTDVSRETINHDRLQTKAATLFILTFSYRRTGSGNGFGFKLQVHNKKADLQSPASILQA